MPRRRRTPNSRLISKKEMLSRVPLSYPTIWDLMRRGKFPRSRSIGRKVAWVESEVEAWIASRSKVKLKGDK
jgi:prophage regulatory protein